MTCFSADIKSWFERTTPLKSFESATSVDIQRTEKSIDGSLPRALKSVLAEVNGGIWLMEKELLSAEKISDMVSSVQSSSLWKDYFVPFAGDESGLLVLNRDGEVCEWDPEDGLSDSISPSLSSYLEHFRDQLLEGHCEFLRDVGVIEKVTGKSRK